MKASRIKITLEYDGADFVGWQAQDNGPSIQAAIEAAIHGFSGEDQRVTGAGRTDAGVHALGQVAHFDLVMGIEPGKIVSALNAYLRDMPISVLSSEVVSDDFSARFSATRRHYLYRLLNRDAPPAIRKGRVWHVARPLEAAAMHEAAQLLIGKHDFTTFRSSKCQAKSPLKTLDKLDVASRGEEIWFSTSARSFLHHQVRSLVGSLKLVGEGKWTAGDLKDSLEARDRNALGFNAPPHGLYLKRVDY
jgi:tRNA pseudouridine38-40 synthase